MVGIAWRSAPGVMPVHGQHTVGGLSKNIHEESRRGKERSSFRATEGWRLLAGPPDPEWGLPLSFPTRAFPFISGPLRLSCPTQSPRSEHPCLPKHPPRPPTPPKPHSLRAGSSPGSLAPVHARWVALSQQHKVPEPHAVSHGRPHRRTLTVTVMVTDVRTITHRGTHTVTRFHTRRHGLPRSQAPSYARSAPQACRGARLPPASSPPPPRGSAPHSAPAAAGSPAPRGPGRGLALGRTGRLTKGPRCSGGQRSRPQGPLGSGVRAGRGAGHPGTALRGARRAVPAPAPESCGALSKPRASEPRHRAGSVRPEQPGAQAQRARFPKAPKRGAGGGAHARWSGPLVAL